ncbi:hypothetical protein EYF80_004104 [Liparis tanakae]|uniref:Uncharacterized protein n=1 Tax=Liparis tanakae TaxID=230148 RepID=A0A4Z2J7Q8_9TELE|nr:hypothetical protein EYF80_004104 [Liparis tanakae]
MKKRLTRGNGVAERIISEEGTNAEATVKQRPDSSPEKEGHKILKTSLRTGARRTTSPSLTCQEADSPEAGVQRGLHGDALVQRRDDALLQVQPVVGADRRSQQPQAADCKDAAQQGQGLPAARAHGDGSGGVKSKESPRGNLEEEKETDHREECRERLMTRPDGGMADVFKPTMNTNAHV